MDEVEVANRGVQQTLVGGAPDALHDSSSGEAAIVETDFSGPDAGGDEDADAEEEEVALPPYPTRWDEEDGPSPGSKEEIAREEGDLGEIFGEEQRDGDGVGGKNRP